MCNRPTVHRLKYDRFQNQKIQSALDKIDRFAHLLPLVTYTTTSGRSSQRAKNEIRFVIDDFYTPASDFHLASAAVRAAEARQPDRSPSAEYRGSDALWRTRGYFAG